MKLLTQEKNLISAVIVISALPWLQLARLMNALTQERNLTSASIVKGALPAHLFASNMK